MAVCSDHSNLTCVYIVPFPIGQYGPIANVLDGVPLICGGATPSSCYTFGNKTWTKVLNFSVL